MLFRTATPDDIPALLEIRLSVTENVLSDPRKVTAEICAAYLSSVGRGWVGEIDGSVVGFCMASSKDASIWALFVRPGYEGRGIGTKLLRLATDWLFEMGVSSISLSTEVNTRADRIYAAHGWKRGEINPNGEVSYSLAKHSLIRGG